MHAQGRNREKSRDAEEHVFEVGIEYGDVCIEYEGAEHGVECQNRGLPSHAIRDVPAPRLNETALARWTDCSEEVVPSVAHEGIQLDSGNKWTFSTLRSFASHVVLDHRDSDDIVYSFRITMVIAVF